MKPSILTQYKLLRESLKGRPGVIGAQIASGLNGIRSVALTSIKDSLERDALANIIAAVRYDSVGSEADMLCRQIDDVLAAPQKSN